jgi:hypothetical protein
MLRRTIAHAAYTLGKRSPVVKRAVLPERTVRRDNIPSPFFHRAMLRARSYKGPSPGCENFKISGKIADVLRWRAKSPPYFWPATLSATGD